MNKSESKYFNTAVKMDMALVSLLKKKSFEYITISELCHEAGVNRSTFYLHYENTCDLLNETARYLLDDFTSYFTFDSKTAALDITNCELSKLNFMCDKYLIPYLTYIKENKEVFLTALSHMGSFGFEDVYARLFDKIFNPILDRFSYPKDDRNYVMMYYLNGINAINLEWLKNGCDKSVEEICKIIRACVFGLNNLIEKSAGL